MATCSESVSIDKWHWSHCGRLATWEWDGKPVCARHLAGKKRSKALTERRNAEWRRRTEEREATLSLCQRLGMGTAHRCTQESFGVLLTMEEAVDLAARLEARP
jgi:hypothetical protein